jgi:hypothetical protein
MNITLDQIIESNASEESSSEDREEFEQRLVELVQACEGDYTKSADSFKGFNLYQGPLPLPSPAL